MFFRLIKPDWGKKKILRNGTYVDNPNFIRSVGADHENTIEGFFKNKSFIRSKNSEGYNVYFFPNHPSKDVYKEGVTHLSGRHIDTFKYVFIDMDLKDKVYASKEEFLAKVAEFPLKPSMVVNSGNGVHVYWKIKDLTRDSYLETQMRLINAFKTDESVWTVLQLMRFPNFKNTKNEAEFKDVNILTNFCELNKEYNIEELLPLLPALEPIQEKKIQKHKDMLDGKITLNLEDNQVPLDELPEKFVDFLLKNYKVNSKGLEYKKEIARLDQLSTIARELFDTPTKRFKDRSKADFALANLLKKAGFSYGEALAVLANTQKAKEKGLHAQEYALCTVSKIYEEETKSFIKEKGIYSVADRLKQGFRKDAEGERVFGPSFFDCLETRWTKTNVLGLIGAPGGGKTTVALNIFKHMIENNPNSDDIFIFFSLEMPEKEILERWVSLVGEDPVKCARLYIVSNEDSEGTPRNINLQDIVEYTQNICKETKKNAGAVVVDHIHILHNTIDLDRPHTFGAEGSVIGVRDGKAVLSISDICKATKPLAKLLNTFLIMLTQTTKEKGKGDTPIDKDGAYGAAQYEWMMDYVITIWQPLMRLYDKTDLRILAWQYAKIRQKSNRDRITTYRQNLLTYEQNGVLRPLLFSEFEKFQELIPQAHDIRSKLKDKKDLDYHNSPFTKDLKKGNMVS